MDDTLTTAQVVIFGGSGFIGTHLARYWLDRGFLVTVADLNVPRLPPQSNLNFAGTDVRRAIELDVHEPAVIYNLAAVHRTPGHPENEYYDTNISGALNVTAWADSVGCREMVFTSSISVYGAPEARVTEATPPAPNTSYGRSKLIAERIHQDWRARGDGRLVIVRPAVVFGGGERGNFTRLARALARGRFVYPGTDQTVKACGYVADLLRAMDFGFKQELPEVLINYAYPDSYTIGDICRAFHDVAGFKLPRSLPAPTARCLRALPLETSRGAGLAALALRGRKLVAPTDVDPRVLRAAGFRWDTDLASGLEQWYTSSPAGKFD